MICLKIDADTYKGTAEGTANLLKVLQKENISASFFVSLGPDESGKAIKRIFKQGFIKKMLRTNAVKLYGFKTMLYGTLLAAPVISKKLAEILKQIERRGHEIGIHAWNHIKWQDELDNLTEAEIDSELNKAVSAYENITGHKLFGFAAPAWKINKTALKCLLKCGFKYLSLTRGINPAYPAMGEIKSDILEIPTTMPTLDEILAWDNMTAEKALDYLINLPKKNELNVYTLHTEVEGISYLSFFGKLINGWRQRGFEFKKMNDIAEEILQNPQKFKLSAEHKEIQFKNFPGRSGKLAVV
jgi:peptidoglycan/xylan/chitin deacetylase (PgdA/CDA1 family)